MIDPSIVSLLKYLKMLTEIHNKVLQLHPNFHLDHIHRKAHGVNCLGMTVLRCLSAESASHLGCGHFGPSSPPRGAVQPKSSGPKANFADKHSSHDAMTLSFDPSIRIKSNTPCQKKIKKPWQLRSNQTCKFKAYSHWVAGQHGVALILLFLWRAFAGVPKVSKAKTCEIHVKSDSRPFSIIFLDVALLNWNKNGFDKVWLRYLAPSYQNASAGTAWKGSFFEVPPVKNFNALCTFTYQSDQYDYDLIVIRSLRSCNWIQRPINHVGALVHE